MSDQGERKRDHRASDLLGLFLSGVGGLFFVSILLSFGEREPKDVIWTTPVVGLIEGLGRAAGLFLAAGVALVGTALFLGRMARTFPRTLFCLLGVALGLALLIGGVVPGGPHGGMLGGALPGLLSGLAGRLAGALIGLLVLGASAGALLPARRPRSERAALPPSLESRDGGEGVSAAEAAALAPPRPRPAGAARPGPAAAPAPHAATALPGAFAARGGSMAPAAGASLGRATPAGPIASPASPAGARPLAGAHAAPSPYPRDVRLDGRVPPGAQPLGEPLRPAARAEPAPARREDRAATTPAQPATVPQQAGPWLADSRALESAPNGPAQPVWERIAHVPPEPAEPWDSPARAVEPELDAPEETSAHAELSLEPPPLAAEPAPADGELAPPPTDAPDGGAWAPRPVTDVTPHEAVETPARAPRKPRAARPGRGAAAPASARAGAIRPPLEEPEEAAAPALELPAPAWEQIGLFDEPAGIEHEPEIAAGTELEGAGSPPSENGAPHPRAGSATEELDLELEEAAMAAAEAEARPVAGEDLGADPELAEALGSDDDDDYDDDEEDDEDDEDDEDEDDEDEDDEDEDDEDEDDDEEDEEDEEDDEDEEDEDEEDEEDEDEEDEDDPFELEDDLAQVEIVAAAEPEPVPEPELPADEPALAPAAQARPAAAAPAAARLDFEQLVHEAGCVVIDQNRVAVSMLQRSFQIDFDLACSVLDQLQERGLIGPYMGGRTRDILLTREEWVAQAPLV